MFVDAALSLACSRESIIAAHVDKASCRFRFLFFNKYAGRFSLPPECFSFLRSLLEPTNDAAAVWH